MEKCKWTRVHTAGKDSLYARQGCEIVCMEMYYARGFNPRSDVSQAEAEGKGPTVQYIQIF
jgi:hypothetical protein